MNTLSYKMRDDLEDLLWREYTARCLRILTENTAKRTNNGQYLNIDYYDLINPKPEIKHKKGEIANKIKSKLR